MTDFNPIHAMQEAEDAIALDILRENFAYDPFEKYGPTGSDTPKETVMPNTDDREVRIDELEGVLRSLASYVGAGGYNADDVDPKTFEDKVRWGIDHLLGVNHVGKLEAKIRELEVRLMASRSARKKAEEELGQLRGHVKTGYMVTCDLSRSLLALQEKIHTMSVDCQESAEHLEKEVSQGQLLGDFKHPKAERAEVLAGCAQRLECILDSTAE